MWRLNNMPIKKPMSQLEIREEIKKNLGTNENGNITFPIPWGVARAVPEECAQ